MSDALHAAVFDPDVQAAVDEAVTLEHVELPAPHEDGHDPLLSNARIVRDPEPADYVAAIHERIDNFDGLDTGDVTEAAVAAVLPQQEES